MSGSSSRAISENVILRTWFCSSRFLNKKIHNLLIHIFRSLYNISLNRLILSTFKNPFFSLSNITFASKLRTRRVVVGTELCSHFLVAHEVCLNYRRIFILSNFRFSLFSTSFENNGFICGFDDLLISFSKASFFGLINSHIRTGSFRGGGGIGDRGGITAKITVRRNYNIKWLQ